jgi:hypothetical protein
MGNLENHTHSRGREGIVRLEDNASAALPSYFRDVASSEDEHLSASIGTVGMSDSGNQRCNIFRLVRADVRGET